MTPENLRRLLKLAVEQARCDGLTTDRMTDCEILDVLNDVCESIRGDLIMEHGTLWDAFHGKKRETST